MQQPCTKELAFRREYRLTTARHYRYVFDRAWRTRSKAFTLLMRVNTEPSARIGMAIAKRQVRYAVDRHRVKRLIRESFRHRRAQLPCVDIVMMCRPIVTTTDNRELFLQLEQLWDNVCIHVSE